MGLKVVGCDARDEPLDLARRLQYPPDVLLDGRKGSQAALALLAENGLRSGVDAVVYATGAQAGVPLALDITKKHGTFVIVGVASFTFDPKSMIFRYVGFSSVKKGREVDVRARRDIHVIGSRASTQADFAELLQLVAEHNSASQFKAMIFCSSYAQSRVRSRNGSLTMSKRWRKLLSIRQKRARASSFSSFAQVYMSLIQCYNTLQSARLSEATPFRRFLQ